MIEERNPKAIRAGREILPVITSMIIKGAVPEKKLCLEVERYGEASFLLMSRQSTWTGVIQYR